MSKTFSLQTIKIEVACCCPSCKNTFTKGISPENISSYAIRSLYADTEDGFVLNTFVTCPFCKINGDLELIRMP
jgi:hypothetical protein